MTVNSEFQFLPSFMLEMGWETGSAESLSVGEISGTLDSYTGNDWLISVDEKKWIMSVETVAVVSSCVQFTIPDVPFNPKLSGSSITIHIPWGCHDDELRKVYAFIYVLAGQLGSVVSHNNRSVSNLLTEGLRLYSSTGELHGKHLWRILDMAGICTALLKPIRKLVLSIRTMNCLRNVQARIVADVVPLTEKELLRINNFDRKCLNYLRDALSDEQLEVGMKFDPAKYCYDVCQGLPHGVVTYLKSLEHGDESRERVILLALADMISMTYREANSDDNKMPTPPPEFQESTDLLAPHGSFELGSPDEVMKKVKAETMRILAYIQQY